MQRYCVVFVSTDICKEMWDVLCDSDKISATITNLYELQFPADPPYYEWDKK